MTAEQFWNEFKKIFDIPSQEAIDKWNYCKDYTDFIIEKMEHIIGEKGAGFETSKEYYRIDLTGWTQKRSLILPSLNKIKNKNDYNFQPYLWDLEVAIEHENDDRLWMDEVIKLLHISCKLKIVIGYIPLQQKDRINEYLGFVSDSIALGGKRIHDDEQFLIILGFSKVSKDNRCQYTPYLYKNGIFEDMSNKTDWS